MSDEAGEPAKPKITGEDVALLALSWALVLLTLAIAIKGAGPAR